MFLQVWDPMDKQKAADFMNAIDRSYVCVGNPEETFVNAWQKKEGKTNCGDVNGEFDRASVVDPKGIVYNGTVRRKGCSILCKVSSSGQSLRCKPKTFRSALRGIGFTPARTSASSALRITPYIKYYNLSFLLCHCKQSLLDLLPKLYRIHH